MDRVFVTAIIAVTFVWASFAGLIYYGITSDNEIRRLQLEQENKRLERLYENN